MGTICPAPPTWEAPGPRAASEQIYNRIASQLISINLARAAGTPDDHAWRETILAHFGEEFLYLLSLFHGTGYMGFFVLLLIWVRFLIRVLQEALFPPARTAHEFVHSLSRMSALDKIRDQDSVSLAPNEKGVSIERTEFSARA